jgi:hypothetical protein
VNTVKNLRVPVNAAKNLRVPKNTGMFLSGCITDGLSSSAQLRRVC